VCSLWSNRAACWLALGLHSTALADCSAAIALLDAAAAAAATGESPSAAPPPAAYARVLARRGGAYGALGDYTNGAQQRAGGCC
jgi:hypothetical protein